MPRRRTCWRPNDTRLVLATSLVVAQGGLLSLRCFYEDADEVFMWATFVVFQLVGIWIIGPLEWYKSLTVIAVWAFFILLFDDEESSLAVLVFIGLILFASLGGAVAGVVGSSLGAGLLASS